MSYHSLDPDFTVEELESIFKICRRFGAQDGCDLAMAELRDFRLPPLRMLAIATRCQIPRWFKRNYAKVALRGLGGYEIDVDELASLGTTLIRELVITTSELEKNRRALLRKVTLPTLFDLDIYCDNKEDCADGFNSLWNSLASQIFHAAQSLTPLTQFLEEALRRPRLVGPCKDCMDCMTDFALNGEAEAHTSIANDAANRACELLGIKVNE